MEYFKTAGDIRYSNIQKYLRDIGIGYNGRVKISVEDGRIVMEKGKIPYDKAVKLAGDFIYKQENSRYIIDVFYNNPCIVTLVYKNNRFKTGMAICKNGDNYSPVMGKALALSRAINKPLPKELQEYLGIHQ